jgi:hypothetical protein
MKHTIKKIDFDNAVKQEWNTSTCVVAQAALRITGKPLHYTGQIQFDPQVYNDTGMLIGFHGLKIQAVFDRHFRYPGDEKKPELVALRASLPIEIELPDLGEKEAQ